MSHSVQFRVVSAGTHYEHTLNKEFEGTKTNQDRSSVFRSFFYCRTPLRNGTSRQ